MDGFCTDESSACIVIHNFKENFFLMIIFLFFFFMFSSCLYVYLFPVCNSLHQSTFSSYHFIYFLSYFFVHFSTVFFLPECLFIFCLHIHFWLYIFISCLYLLLVQSSHHTDQFISCLILSVYCLTAFLLS